MASKFTELAIDCADPHRLARFWCAVLGYEVQHREEPSGTGGAGDAGGAGGAEEGPFVGIGSPLLPEGRERSGPVPPTLTFARVPEGKTVKNLLSRISRHSGPGRTTRCCPRRSHHQGRTRRPGRSW
ncbi:VOC family protein [Streptomyces sp. NPDC091377]|uniref:VOC family protein n=1 Tax=Streptomyces sp. NPDC091377 TaxID=3365995 RepID=UPI003828B6B4